MQVEISGWTTRQWANAEATYTVTEWAVIVGEVVRYHGHGTYAEENARADAEGRGGTLSTRTVRITAEEWSPR